MLSRRRPLLLALSMFRHIAYATEDFERSGPSPKLLREIEHAADCLSPPSTSSTLTSVLQAPQSPLSLRSPNMAWTHKKSLPTGVCRFSRCRLAPCSHHHLRTAPPDQAHRIQVASASGRSHPLRSYPAQIAQGVVSLSRRRPGTKSSG